MEQKKKILVIEDEPINQQLIQETLLNSGFDVVLASNGQEGLDKVYLEHPDLVVCDVLMPVMDGYAFYKELRRDEIYAQLPVIILTAREQMEDTFKAVGVNGFLAKPYNAEILLDEVNRLFTAQPQAAPGTSRTVPAKAVTPKVPQPLNRKVIIVGRDSNITNGMNRQLDQEKCGVLVIKDESHLSLHFDHVNPDLILLQIFDDGYKSIIDLLLELKKLINRKFEDAQKRPTKSGQFEYKVPYILLYKVSEEVQSGSAMVQKAAETETLVKRCGEILPLKYLGIYVPDTFISKILIFLG